ncbi:hypothetical protein THASP1DRAFT_32255 [Thamnocephalis sphaerospora]|uniref:Uncharacterized protein n=1 Tax=Thamnocephalis sphaerospora TaxID=78915 RepID=A0A4P9XJL9_9FUNG|nr:hypothetical protein THASP1DRAFT_32255 [Thamnocephalis sphaerospora]|eukprot:RKP05916.1 hypothetical protein THASP1DRAFT_32255 [Thamnocephalis sphaerospora]
MATPTSSKQPRPAAVSELNAHFGGRLTRLAVAATYRTDIKDARIIAIMDNALLLGYRFLDAPGPATGAESMTTMHCCQLPLHAQQMGNTESVASAIEDMIVRIQSRGTTTKRHVEYFQRPSWSVLIVVGNASLDLSYNLIVWLHGLEALFAVVFCYRRQYSWRTTALWAAQILAVGFFSTRYLLWPRPLL